MINRFAIALLTIPSILVAQQLTSESNGTRQTEMAAELGFSSAGLQGIDTLISTAIEEQEIAGAVALIARNGRLVYSKAFGMRDRDDREPMETDTLFRIASMTKPVTSLAVMMLHEEGHFELTDPVANYIPEFSDARVLSPGSDGSETVPTQSDITILQLLTHTSGLSYGFMSNTEARETLARIYREADISDGFEETDDVIADLSRKLDDLPLLFEPGTGYAYGLSTDVLGHLVEVISGVTLAEFFDERIFGPLEMHESAFYIDEEDIDRLAAMYTSAEDGGIREIPEGPIEEGYLNYSVNYPYTGPRSYYSGGAGLVSTAGDYLRLMQMFLNGGELDGVRLLSSDSVELMTRNNIGELAAGPGLKFGLGFAVVDDPELLGSARSRGTYFWGGIFHTRFFVDPSEQLIGIFMAQRRPRDPVTIRDRFVDAVYQAIDD